MYVCVCVFGSCVCMFAAELFMLTCLEFRSSRHVYCAEVIHCMWADNSKSSGDLKQLYFKTISKAGYVLTN